MSESDSDSDGDAEVGLGFALKPETPTALLRNHFPSKLGGLPAWLDPVHLPLPEQLVCAESGLRLRFLLQVYAAVNDEPHAFHRALYLFVSPQGSLLERAGAVRAFRCQLPRENPFYAHEPPEQHERPRPLSAEQARAAAARNPCWARWQAEHEAVAAGAPPTPPRIAEAPGADETRTFPEHELVVSAEEVEKTSGPRDPQATRLLAEFEAGGAGSGGAGTDAADASELAGIAASFGADRPSAEQLSWAHFTARVACAPEQCLRYCFEPHARPLWPARAQRAPARVPPCERCGAARRFEFQVLPQALHFMGIDSSHAEAPGWATIVVYSCEASCAPPPLPLADGTGTLADVAEGVAGDAARCAAIGLRVRLMDLNRRAELNGQSGLVVGWSAAAERWEVCLESGEKLRVRSVNLRPVDGSAASRSRGYVEEYVWVQPQPEDPRLGVDGLQP